MMESILRTRWALDPDWHLVQADTGSGVLQCLVWRSLALTLDASRASS